MLLYKTIFLSFSAFFAISTAHAQWIQTPYSGSVYCFAVSGSTLIIGTDNGVFRSTNSGTSWSDASTGFPNTNVYAITASGANLFAAANGNGVFHSTNSGTSWAETSTGLPTDTVILSIVSDGANLLAGTYGDGVFRSTDSGTNWTKASFGLTNPFILILAANGANLFAGTDGGGVFLSNDSGKSWTAENTGLPMNASVHAFAVIGTDLFAGTKDSGVFLSTNRGTSWRAVNSGLPGNVFFEALIVTGTNLFAGSYGEGIFSSTDSGSSWKNVNTGLRNSDVYALAVADTNLFAGTELGVMRRPLSEIIASSVVAEALPSRHEIQSYPNPFSQSTEITFSSEAAGYAEVSIVNMLGSEVARLFSGQMDAGEHSFNWDANVMPSGMYECIVQMNGSVNRAAMIRTP